MAGSVNKVILIGRLGKDPESRTSQSGDTIVSFSVATSESWKNRNGEKQEKTEWHKVVVFNPHLADIAATYLKKGSHVYIEGALQTRKWQAQDGTDRYSTEVVLGRFKGELSMLGSKDDDTQKTTAAQHKAAKDGWEPPPDMDDDIPW